MSTCKFSNLPHLDPFRNCKSFTRTEVETGDPQDDAQFAGGDQSATVSIDCDTSDNVTSVTLQMTAWNEKRSKWKLGKTITFKPGSWESMQENCVGRIFGFIVTDIQASDMNPTTVNIDVAIFNRVIGGN